MSIQVDTSKWIKGKNYPEWMDDIAISMISKGYLLPDEDVFDAYKRVSKAASRRLKRKDLQPFFMEAIVKNWLCLASPDAADALAVTFAFPVAHRQYTEKTTNRAYNANGVKMERLSLSPEEAQYIEQRKFSAQEIARMFGVPSSMIGANDGGVKSSVEQEFQDFYARTLLAYAINIEQEMGRKLLTEQDKPTMYFKFNFNSLLRATANDRADFYNKGIRGGWLSPNEARMWEDMNGYTDGAGYMVEANLIPADRMDEYMEAKIINLTNKALNNNNPDGNNNNTQA